MGKNFTEITQFLNELKYTFDIIAISESWLDDKTAAEFNLDGYEVINQIRLDKKGGGCSLYIRDIFKFKVVNKYCYSVTDLLECCTVG